MTISFRQIAVSGGAAVALLGGAAAITATASAPASAATQQTVEHAATAPVTLPDGRTVRITGMGGYGHQATTDHIAAVAAYTSDTSGQGTQLQYPTQQVPAGYNQQVTTQAGGGAIGVGVVTILVLAIIVFYKVRHGGLKTGDAVLGGLFGIALSGTVIGAMGSQLTNSLVGSLGTMLGGLG
jgi:ABC-type glycerol-3-phosphate transport system substrate-binding protein